MKMSCNKQSKREMKKNNSIYNSIRKNKILRVNLSKEVHDLHTSNYKRNTEGNERRAKKTSCICGSEGDIV